MSMPAQKPGLSKQTYETPSLFVQAAAMMLGIDHFAVDLAADGENHKAPYWYSEADDTFTKDWHKIVGWCWLNPPFSHLAPWVQKACVESQRGARVAVLLPAGVSTEWYAQYVHERAHVLFVRPRLTFVGETDPYPKDLMLALFDGVRTGTGCWKWK